MASRSGMFLDESERKRLIQTLESSGDLKRSSSSGDFSTGAPNKGGGANDTGCLVCLRDDDHNNLMLCEGCNDEYHIYCLVPPLSAVPHDDWYCDKCTGKTKKAAVQDDGLSSLVTALPREYTSRFGEVCFAYGGFGFGWWPSCIFDPRLTEGSARQTAKKNLGKKHLVYFFECHEAPFAVLSNTKVVGWTEGLAENYHLGKTARAAGKQRALQFQHALQAAVVEEDKPLDMRLDWNRSDEQAQLLPIPKKVKKRKRTATDGVHLSPPGIKRGRPDSDSEESRVKRKKKKRQDGPLFCRIVNRAVSGSIESGGSNTDDVNIGFVKLSSTKKSTFFDARKAVMKELVPEAIARTSNWKFHVSTLGPVTSKQETSLGPILPFLRSGIGGNVANGGSIEDPITVVIFESQD